MTTKRTTRSKSAIEALRPTPEDPNVVEVRVGGRTVASMLRHRAQELGLEVGAKWTPAIAARVSAACALELAREAAFALLAKRAYAAHALQAKLEAGGHAEAAAAAAVAALVADGWLDDAAFAAERATHLQRRGPVATDALAERLEAEGVGEAVARAAAKRATPADETHAALLREARTARRAGESASRVGNRFARRGFEADTIESVLEAAGFRLEPD